MNRLLTVGLMSALLAACVADPIEGDGSSSSAPSSDANIPNSSVSSVVSSSSVGVVTPPAPTPAPNPDPAPSFNGDAANGLSLFSAKKCTSCHLDEDGDGYFAESLNPFDPDDFGNPGGTFGTYDASTRSGIAKFVSERMGPFVGGCDQQCGEDIAAYLWLQKNGIVGPIGEAASCLNPEQDAIHYGRRALHVLTSYEYSNSLKQLFNAPLPADYSSPVKISADTEVARLPNHISETISETRLNSFYDNASELATWAIETAGALPFDCPDADTCATNLANDFAYVAYRRLLTPEETNALKDILAGAADLNDGLKWALTTVLSSPHFLYRSELGRTVAEALNEKPLEADPNQLGIANPISLEIDDKTYDESGFADFGSYDYKGKTPSYNWTGNDIVKVSVSGKGRFGLKIGGEVITEEDIDFATPKGLTFKITHAKGTGKYVQVYNQSPNTIKISRLSIGEPAKFVPPAQEDKALLRKADSSAYVLTPFEYASALSFALTGSSPSRELLDAAKAGELFGGASLDNAIDDLIDSELGQAHVERLAGKWFRTDGLSSKVRNNPDFTPAVRSSMMQEIREIYKHAFYNGDFPSIYAGDFTFLDSTLASFYGLGGSGGSAPGSFQKVDTTGTLRGGIIASGAYMAYNAHMDYTSPILRSTHFRQDVLCQSIPQPVNLEDSDERDIAAKRAADRVSEGSITTAEYYDIQTNVKGSSCAGCHNAIINPMFGIDDFDNVGRLRKRVGGQVVQDGLTLVNGLAVPKGEKNIPIDFVNKDGFLFSPEVVGTLSTSQADADKEINKGIAFSGSKDLGQKIVQNELPGISACLIEKTTRYAMGYTLRKDLLEDSEKKGASYLNISDAQESEFLCVQDELNAAYDQAKSPRDVLKALVKSSAFRFRK